MADLNVYLWSFCLYRYVATTFEVVWLFQATSHYFHYLCFGTFFISENLEGKPIQFCDVLYFMVGHTNSARNLVRFCR